jgi:hypothetical protein
MNAAYLIHGFHHIHEICHISTTNEWIWMIEGFTCRYEPYLHSLRFSAAESWLSCNSQAFDWALHDESWCIYTKYIISQWPMNIFKWIIAVVVGMSEIWLSCNSVEFNEAIHRKHCCIYTEYIIYMKCIIYQRPMNVFEWIRAVIVDMRQIWHSCNIRKRPKFRSYLMHSIADCRQCSSKPTASSPLE